jgi:iron(III) transport system substrate-binding protein
VPRNTLRLLAAGFVVGLLLSACGSDAEPDAEGTASGSVTIYSGRSEELVGPVIERFEEATGIRAEVRYGDTAELAAQILEEGDNSPADVFWAQDAGALGALQEDGRFAELPRELLDRVPARFRSTEGRWVGTSGRARVLVYNVEGVETSELPKSVLDLDAPAWKGRVGWAPTNGSFQAFVTALRKVEGEDAAEAWLRGMKANEAKVYEGNSAIVSAVAAGEIDAGLVNHYYLLEMSEDDPGLSDKAKNHFFPGGDPGSLVNAAGVGIIDGADNAAGAEAFADFLLSRTARDYFDEEVFEYPLSGETESDPSLPKLADIEQPDIDLSDLSDLEGTLELLREVGVL